MSHRVTLVAPLLLLACTAAAEEKLDEVTLRQARDGFAAEVYRLIAPSLSDELAEKKLSSEVADRLVFKTVTFIADCVVSDLVARPIAGSEVFIRSLATLPPDMPVRETVKLRHGGEVPETLWFNVDYLLEKCTGRAYEILGLTK